MNVRPATMNDAPILYKWRTEGELSSWYEGPPTSFEDHCAWLEARLASPSVKIWIVELNEVVSLENEDPITLPIGVIRLDSNDELSVEIDPEWRGLGYGTKAIQWACDQAGGRVKACVDSSNEAARKAFAKAGFKLRPDVEFWIWRP